MPSRKITSRKAAALNLMKLANLFYRRKAFECSKHFRNSMHSPDEQEPLEAVHWNAKTLRYEITSSSSKKDKLFVIDDAILQAMAMLFIVGRIQHGWTQLEACAQLSVWPKDHPKMPPQASPLLRNQWGLERQQLIRDKKLGKKTMYHVQNYNTFASLYAEEDTCWPNENRKAKSSFGSFHGFTEHSCIQWALAQREQDPQLSELAVLLLKLLWQCDYSNRKEVMATATTLSELLVKEGEKGELEHEHHANNFSQRVMVAMEQVDWENQIDSFEIDKFEETFRNQPRASVQYFFETEI